MTNKYRLSEEARDKIAGFLEDLESDIKQYGLTDSIKESAIVVFQQVCGELGWKSPEEVEEIEKQERERIFALALQSIADEPEFPDDMPNELWEEIKGDREIAQRIMQNTVRITKREITDRFAASSRGR